MVLPALSAVLPAFCVEVLAFSLEEAGVRKAPGLVSGLSRLPKTSPSLMSREKSPRRRGGLWSCPRCRGPEALPHLQYLQELPEEPDPLRLQGYLLKG